MPPTVNESCSGCTPLLMLYPSVLWILTAMGVCEDEGVDGE